MDKAFTSYKVEERSYVSYIKREIQNQVMRSRFTENNAAKINIIVSEIASNMVKHAKRGEILFKVVDSDERSVEASSTFEIISIDDGPGMEDMAGMMQDGVSTTRSLGHGLGSIFRLSDKAQVYSIPGWGTVLYAMVKTKSKKKSTGRSAVEIAMLAVSKPNETVCGDGYLVMRDRSDVVIFFGDGLGHGQHAKKAVDTAEALLLKCTESEPDEIVRHIHKKIRRTRGLVGAVAICDLKNKEWRICGVGNIFTRLYSGIEFEHYVPYNGVIGLNLPSRMKASSFAMERNQSLIMCSDGIQTRWDLNKYPSILRYESIIVAAAIYKDFKRENDDSSVLIAKVI